MHRGFGEELARHLWPDGRAVGRRAHGIGEAAALVSGYRLAFTVGVVLLAIAIALAAKGYDVPDSVIGFLRGELGDGLEDLLRPKQ